MAERMGLVSMIDEMLLTVQTSAGTVAIKLIEASGSGRHGCWLMHRNSSG
jgi:hypothetical protein